MRMKDEDWASIIDTNLTSVFRTSKAVMRGMMKARKGRIINIASVVGVTGNAGQANYAAAKAGIIGFSKSLAKEIGSRGVTVNVVAHGFIDTDMTKALPEEARTALINDIALERRIAGRHRPCGGLGQPGCRLHHRRNPPCERRHVHAVSKAQGLRRKWLICGVLLQCKAAPVSTTLSHGHRP